MRIPLFIHELQFYDFAKVCIEFFTIFITEGKYQKMLTEFSSVTLEKKVESFRN